MLHLSYFLTKLKALPTFIFFPGVSSGDCKQLKTKPLLNVESKTQGRAIYRQHDRRIRRVESGGGMCGAKLEKKVQSAIKVKEGSYPPPFQSIAVRPLLNFPSRFCLDPTRL